MDLETKRAEIISRMLNAKRNAPSEQSKTDQPVEGGKVVPEPMAIVGLSGYFPQCANVEEFWDAVDKDKCLIKKMPPDRLDWQGWAGTIPDIRGFDPEFFGILPGTAGLMDPRKRLLLMCVYHAIEDSGYAPQRLKNSHTGVFIAIEDDEYGQCLRKAGIGIDATDGPSSSLLANRLSYFFDLAGPSEVINTMCSGAAVAIHRAIRALRTGEISCALVGAANVMLTPEPFDFLQASGQLSDSDRVDSFGKDAKGFIRADGVAAIVLKPLSKAVQDKDAIYAVIKNTAVNYNGRGGLSMSAPNVAAHTELIRTCYEQAGIDPGRVSYIEAQGMGNPVADLAEWEAFNRALKAMAGGKDIGWKKGGCGVSTIKPMTGHMHAASALGALFKVIRSLQTNKLHGIAGFKEINPELDVDGQPCRLITATEQWPEERFPRLAGIHSFGSGGNNAHLLIEEYKEPEANAALTLDDPKGIVLCSAPTEKQCKIIVKNLLDFVTKHTDDPLGSIAYTMRFGRDVMKYRVVFVSDTREMFISQAGAYLRGNEPEGVFAGEAAAKADALLAKADEAYSRQPLRRLHLPVYPFDRSEHWVGDKATAKRGLRAEGIVRDLLSQFLSLSPGEIDIERQ